MRCVSRKNVEFVVGLDLGRPAEPTAIAVLALAPERSFALRHLQRFPPGTPYPEVLTATTDLLRSKSLAGRAWLLADYTGAGWPVLKLFERGLRSAVTCLFSGVLLTASGTAVPNHRPGLAIPKGDVVGVLQVMLQTRRLRVADLPETATLVRELAAYRPKVVLSPTDATTWREGAHDDLVLAVGLAAWGAEVVTR
jgi:hypothetical protein